MRNLCIIIECDLHVLWPHFLRGCCAFSMPYLTMYLYVCGQLKFGETFHSVPAQVFLYVIFIVLV